MIWRCFSLLLLILGLIALQQGLRWAGQLELFAEESHILKEKDIEPAAMFYTECPQASQAEQILRGQL